MLKVCVILFVRVLGHWHQDYLTFIKREIMALVSTVVFTLNSYKQVEMFHEMQQTATHP